MADDAKPTTYLGFNPKNVTHYAILIAFLASLYVAYKKGTEPPPPPVFTAPAPAQPAGPLPPPDAAGADVLGLAGDPNAPGAVRLSGDALVGVDSSPIMRLAADAAPPQAVFLGRAKPSPEAMRAMPGFPQKAGAAPPPKSTENRRVKATGPLSRMYLNDRYGCCVISGKYHILGFVSAVDGGPAIQVPDQTIYDQYTQRKAGRGDSGCVITDVLDFYRKNGIPANGQSYKLDGYVRVNPRNAEQVKAATYLFGALTIGVNLPQAWTQNAVWDVTNSPIVGGHDVAVVDYDDDGVYVSSWGKVYRITWPAFTNGRYVEECYAQLQADWYANAEGGNRVAPSGADVDKLRGDLSVLAAGGVPDVGPVGPPPPNPTDRTVTVKTAELDAAGVRELTITLKP